MENLISKSLIDYKDDQIVFPLLACLEKAGSKLDQRRVDSRWGWSSLDMNLIQEVLMFRKLLVMKDMKSALAYSDVFSDGPKISLEAKVLIVALVKTIFTHYKNTNKEKICFLVSICGILTFSVNPTKKTKMN